jgi:hypothetical protein
LTLLRLYFFNKIGLPPKVWNNRRFPAGMLDIPFFRSYGVNEAVTPSISKMQKAAFEALQSKANLFSKTYRAKVVRLDCGLNAMQSKLSKSDINRSINSFFCVAFTPVLIKEPVPDVGVENYNTSDVHQGDSTQKGSLFAAERTKVKKLALLTIGSLVCKNLIKYVRRQLFGISGCQIKVVLQMTHRSMCFRPTGEVVLFIGTNNQTLGYLMNRSHERWLSIAVEQFLRFLGLKN